MVSLLILVTGNRQMEVRALRPRLYWSFSSVTRPGSSGPCASEGSIQNDGIFFSLLHQDALSTGPGGDRWQNRPSPDPVRGSSPAHADVSAHGASSSCASCLSLSWHTWSRTTASLPEELPLIPHRASGTSHHSHHSRS